MVERSEDAVRVRVRRYETAFAGLDIFAASHSPTCFPPTITMLRGLAVRSTNTVILDANILLLLGVPAARTAHHSERQLYRSAGNWSCVGVPVTVKLGFACCSGRTVVKTSWRFAFIQIHYIVTQPSYDTCAVQCRTSCTPSISNQHSK